MRYCVHAMGCHYATFTQMKDAQEWAQAQSIKYPNHWWEIRDVDRTDVLIIAFDNGNPVYGHENFVLN